MTSLRAFLKNTSRALAGPILSVWIYLCARTCRWEFIDCDGIVQVIKDPNEGFILMTPHENVLSVLILGHAGWPFKGRAVISNHGATVAWVYDIIEAMGVKTILVDKHNPVANIASEVRQALQEKDSILITPDGPLGPPHIFNPDAWLLARRNKVKVVMLSGFWNPQLRFGTWDRQKLPLPFSKAYITGLEPFKVGKEFMGLSRADIIAGRADPMHPAVKIPADLIKKTDALERKILGKNR